MIANLRNIVSYFRPYWPIALFGIAISSFLDVLDLVVPYITGQIINLLSGKELDATLQAAIDQIQRFITPQLTNHPISNSLSPSTFSLSILLGIAFLVTVMKAPIQPWCGSWLHWNVALRAKQDHMGRAIAKILTLPLEFYDDHNPGRIAGWVMRGLTSYTWIYPDVAGQGIPKLVRLLGILLILGFIQWQVACLFLGLFGLTLAIGCKDLKPIMQREKELDRYIETTESRTSEIITNIKTVKAFATETDELIRQKRRLQREFLKAYYKVHKRFVVLLMQQRIVISACQFLVLSLTVWATLQGQISIGHLITILAITNMAYADLEPLNLLAEQLARRYVSMVRFQEFMHLRHGSEALSLTHQPAAVKQYQFTGKIEFANVTFGYETDPMAQREVLQNINLVIQPCQTIALIGRSGSGKSTLVKLLLRYFEPQQGQILIDGQPICSLDITGYRRRLAIVHQDVDVFNGTLWENLTYGQPQATAAEVDAACHMARVDEFAHQLPQGYRTIVGERGMRLSGGQRQRLGIARALLVNPDVLIFDEATSSLDSESERSIQLAMNRILGTRTTILIAHRLSTVRDADQIVVLDQGRIVEMGNHPELLAIGGLYHRLYTLQSSFGMT